MRRRPTPSSPTTLLTLTLALIVVLGTTPAAAGDGVDRVEAPAVLVATADEPAEWTVAPQDGDARDDEATEPTHGVMSLLDEAPSSTQPDDRATREHPATAARIAAVDPDVLDALGSVEDAEVAVIIHLVEQPDLGRVTIEATRAARAAAAELRNDARVHDQDTGASAQAARQAAHEARVATVVDNLQATAEATNNDVGDLLGQLEDAGQAHDVREYWVFNGFAATVDRDALERLAAHEDIATIVLDNEVQLPDLDEGPRLPTWSLETVQAPRTWGDYGFRGQGVVVGVLDSGVDGTHPALAGSYRGRDGDHASSWYVATGENYPTPGDGHGHGTHVTGSITGGPPGEVVGVAPAAEWIGAKIFNDFGGTNDSIIVDAMQWILAPGGDPAKAPHVVNNSWGANNPTIATYWDPVAAWVAAGIFPVFANGNAGPGAGTVGSPASFPHAFGVGATDINDVAASFSSRGPSFWDGERYLKPQVSAPGHEIRSTWPRHTGQDYRTISGTSMATPHVSGVAALVLSAHPDATVDDLRDILQDTVKTGAHMGSLPNDTYGHGIVDAHTATTRAAFSGLVTGTVSGPDGPIEATIAVPDQGVSTTSDPETGEYALFVRQGMQRVTATAYGHVPAAADVEVVAHETTVADFTLAAAPVATLSGTVTAATGPVAGASVHLTTTPLDPVLTDASGSFSIEVAEGTHHLRATAHGYLPTAQDVVVAGDTSMTLELRPIDQTPSPGWREYQNDATRTGFSDEDLAPATFDRLWSTALGSQVLFSSPVIGSDHVYLTTDNGRLHALDVDTGAVSWTFSTGGVQRSTPAVVGDRLYVAGGDDSTLYALDAATGSVHWTYSTGTERLTYATPTEVGGTVYLTTGFGAGNGGFVHAIDAASGEQRWRSEVGPQIFFGPTVADGKVFAASRDDNRVAAFDAATGDELWSFVHDNTFISMPAYAGGVLFTGTSTDDFSNGSVLAIDAETGNVLWEADGHGEAQGSSPVVYGDLVIAGSHSHSTVSAYDRETGELAWRHGAGAAVSSAQLATAGGVLLGGSQDHRVWALDASTGTPLWEDTLTDNVLSAPAAADGLTVFADRRGQVVAYVTTGTVSGTVTGPDGPVEARLRIAETGEETTSDPDTGEYELVHRPGSYTLEVRAYGFTQDDAPIDVVTGRTVVRDFHLDAVGEGTLSGTVTDEAGQPIEGATVTLAVTPLQPAVTGDDGSYAFDTVAAGSYTILVDADGYAPQEDTVTVTAGAATVADFALTRYDIAVVADYEGMITNALEADGWLVDRVTFADIVGTTDRYGAVVIAGMTGDRADADPDRFVQIVDAADAAGTSLVFLDQWSLAYGSVRPLSNYTGDPASVEVEGSNRGQVWLEDVVPHPITASLPTDARVPLLTNGDHAWFSGYTGQSLGRLGAAQTGQRGDGIGYQRRTLSSSHILLPSHAPTPWANPHTTWLPAMWDLLADAVAHAVDADYGAVAGTVTGSGGDPVPAGVEVVDGREHTTADDAGAYELLLEPGEYTLRFRHLGAQTTDVDVTIAAGATVDLDVQLADSGLGTVTGQVTDEATGAAISGATVTVVDTDLPAATTGSDGRYVVDGVPGGTYDISFDAVGYLPLTIEDVAVTDGQVATVDAQMASAPNVVVVGDRNSDITQFLTDNAIPAIQAGWGVTDDLTDIDVVVLNNPANIGQDEFLGHLAAFDAAGVSVVFTADGWATRTRGIDLLVRHTGDPQSFGRIGAFNGPEVYLHDLADHPLFAGIDTDPVQLLTAGSEAGFVTGYSGIALADIALAGSAPAGTGIAYNPRTPDSVHLILGGLASAINNNPADWTPDGQRIFLNAMRWAATPGLGTLTGTVTDPDEHPIVDAQVVVAGTSWSAITDDDGHFAIGVPAGEHTLDYRAFGYVPDQRTVTVAAGQTLDASVQLEVADVGSITGVVTSSGVIDPDGTTAATALEGVRVELLGTPRHTVTDENGVYTFERVEPGAYELELETDGHVRTLADVEVAPDQTTQRDIELRASPLVGIIDDSDWSNSRDRGKEFLEDWGYRVEDIGWDSLERIPALDLIVANISAFPNPDPGFDGFKAFEDAVNRAGVPVLWMDQHGRGAIQYLRDYDADPGVRDHGFNHGTVTATVVEDHPLVAGLPDEFELTEPQRRYAWFDDFGGTTVARLSTGTLGEVGDTIGYRGRTATTVDVLLSTLSINTWGAPSTRQSPALFWTPEAERVYVNALAWALDAGGLGAEVRGAVQNQQGERIRSEVEVVETGRTYQGRAGDGTFVVPLQPGTWTLRVSSFAYATATYEVTVAAGDSDRPTITLASGPSGTIEGRVTDAAGTPVSDATVSLVGAPRSETTGTDGRYRLEVVPEGAWTVEARASGSMVARADVTVDDDQTITVDFTLQDSDRVAVAGDHDSQIDKLLASEGYTVDQYAYNAIDQIEPVVGDYDLVVLNGQGTQPSAAMFTSFLDAAAAADTSIVFTGMHARGSIRHLTAYLGDPESVTASFAASPIYFEVDEPHPIFAGIDISEPIELMRDVGGGNQQYMYYTGYSGETIATLDAPGRPDGGDGVGYAFASAQSVHLLLTNLMATPTFGFPDLNWTEDAKRIYLNSVAWAIDASQGEIHGIVTSGGEPLAGATVRAVEAGTSTRTAADGSYRMGVSDGQHTVEVSADGYETATVTVTVGESEQVQVDVDLVRLPRGDIEVVVVDAGDETAIHGANVSITGPMDRAGTTDDAGRVVFDDLLEGSYEVTVTATGYLVVETGADVVAGGRTLVAVEMSPNDVAVVGDVDGVLTAFLRDAGEAAEERTWSDLTDAIGRYEVVVVNGGTPTQEEFLAVVDAADDAGTSLVFTGTWGVDRGGIRLLEQYTDDVVVGGQGYGDGPVSISGFDPDHPVFHGLDGPQSPIVADDGYYSWLDDYVGHHLADLAVGGDRAGVSVAYDFRGADHVHLLLSVTAVSEVMGPGYGWTSETAQLVANAVDWARSAEQPLPAVPTIATDEVVVATPTVTVQGEAEFRSTVSVMRGDEVLGTVEPDRSGAYHLDVDLVEGENVLRAVATNHAGATASEPLSVWLVTSGPDLDWTTPLDGQGFFDPGVTIAGTADGGVAGIDRVLVNGEVADLDDGAWSYELVLDPGPNDITVEAFDTLGNRTIESRTVALLAYTASWQVPDESSSAVNVRLQILDAAGRSTDVGAVALEAHASTGTIHGPYDMVWRGQRYQHVLLGLPPDDYDLVAHLEVEGWRVVVRGPTVSVT